MNILLLFSRGTEKSPSEGLPALTNPKCRITSRGREGKGKEGDKRNRRKKQIFFFHSYLVGTYSYKFVLSPQNCVYYFVSEETTRW